MRNLILLMAALVITSCQKDDMDELKSVPPEGPSGIVSKASSLTAKTNGAYAPLFYSADEFNAIRPSITPLTDYTLGCEVIWGDPYVLVDEDGNPILDKDHEEILRQKEIINCELKQGAEDILINEPLRVYKLIEELEYAYAWFTLHKDQLIDRQVTIDYLTLAIELKKQANNLHEKYYPINIPQNQGELRDFVYNEYLDTWIAWLKTKDVVQGLYDILKSQGVNIDELKAYSAPKTIDVRSQDNRIEQADTWNNALNIEFYGELIAVTKWEEDDITYIAYTYQELNDGIKTDKILAWVYSYENRFYGFKGIVHYTGSYSLVYEANDYTVKKTEIEKCRKFLMQTRVTAMTYNSNRLSSLEDRVRNDRQKVEFNPNDAVFSLRDINGLRGKVFTMERPFKSQDNCGVGF